MNLSRVLADHLLTPFGRCTCGAGDEVWGIDDDAPWRVHVAEVFRESLMVRSVEELDALPDDTAVLVDDVPARKHLGDWYFANDDGDGYGSKSLALYLPALVLYRPDWDTP